MAEMSPKEVQTWRKRLEYAKAMWVQHGLIGNTQPSTMRLSIEMYRSNQWKHLNRRYGLSSEELRSVNKLFPTANQQQAETAARNPRVQLFPRNEESRDKAMPVQRLHNYDIIEQNHIRQLNGAFRDHQFAPFGIVRHGFTPEEEYATDKGRLLDLYRPAHPERPWIRRVAPWNGLLDPRAESFHPDGGMEWCAFRQITTARDIRDNPGLIERQDLDKIKGNVSREWRNMLPMGMRGPADPDADEDVEYWVIYELRERTWFGITLEAGMDKPIRQKADWPIPWESLPVNVFTVNEQMDTPFAISLLETMLPLQEELNRVRTIISRIANRIMRLVGVDTASVPQEEIDKLEDAELLEIIKVTGDPAKAIADIHGGVLPQELLLYASQVEEDLREVGTQSKMKRGQRVNVESGTEAAGILAGQSEGAGRVEDHFLKFVEETERTYLQGRRAAMVASGDSEIVPIVGFKDAEKVIDFATVSPEMIAGEFEFEVVAGSTRRLDYELEAQKAGADMAIALQSPNVFNIAYFARKYAEARQHDPSEALTPEAFEAAELAADAVDRDNELRSLGINEGGGNGAAPGGGVDANALVALGGGAQ